MVAGSNLTIENINIYGTNFYGPVKVNGSGGTINYGDMTYTGAELVNATGSKVNIYGTVNVTSTGVYTSNIQTTTTKGGSSDGSNNQQNLEISQMELIYGSTYNGFGKGGHLIELSGNLKLNPGSIMNLNPDLGTTNPEYNNGIKFPSVGLLINKAGSIDVNGATLNINPMNGAYALNAQGNINIYNGGLLNVNMVTPITNNITGTISAYPSPVVVGGAVKVTDGGTFKIVGSSNYNASTGSLLVLVETLVF